MRQMAKVAGCALRDSGTLACLRQRAIAGAALACLILALAGSGWAAADSHRGARTCATRALRVVSFGGQGAARTEFAFLRFELRRPGRCTLSGYPGVTLLNGHHQLNLHVGRYDDGLRDRAVRIDTRHPAYFSLVYFAPPCAGGRIRVTGLRIVPPRIDRRCR